MSLVIVAGYFVLFVCTPFLVRNMTKIDPFEYTNKYVNIQSFNDLVHVCIITLFVFTGNTKSIPRLVFVYFLLDIVFNFKAFMINTTYLVHHIFGCFHTYLVYKYFMAHVETLGFFIWLQETALIPIIFIDILRMQSIKIPPNLYVLRALWYISTRLYTYGLFFYNADRFQQEGFNKKLMKLFCTPLIMHNANVFKLQIQSMLRVLRK